MTEYNRREVLGYAAKALAAIALGTATPAFAQDSNPVVQEEQNLIGAMIGINNVDQANRLVSYRVDAYCFEPYDQKACAVDSLDLRVCLTTPAMGEDGVHVETECLYDQALPEMPFPQAATLEAVEYENVEMQLPEGLESGEYALWTHGTVGGTDVADRGYVARFTLGSDSTSDNPIDFYMGSKWDGLRCGRYGANKKTPRTRKNGGPFEGIVAVTESNFLSPDDYNRLPNPGYMEDILNLSHKFECKVKPTENFAELAGEGSTLKEALLAFHARVEDKKDIDGDINLHPLPGSVALLDWKRSYEVHQHAERIRTGMAMERVTPENARYLAPSQLDSAVYTFQAQPDEFFFARIAFQDTDGDDKFDLGSEPIFGIDAIRVDVNNRSPNASLVGVVSAIGGGAAGAALGYTLAPTPTDIRLIPVPVDANGEFLDGSAGDLIER